MAWPTTLARTKDWGSETLTDSDLEGQFDLIITYINDMMDETTGHKHDGTAEEGPKIALASAVSGTLPLANGGTGQTSLAGLLGLVYPVGCIYTNITGTNPGTELGFGTWTAFGAGRVMVGYDSGDTDFDTAEETGGSKTHTLTTDEIPAHTHSVQTFTGGSTAGNGPSSNTNLSGTTGSTGGGSAHNNVQPYIVVHHWKRTA